MSPNPIGMTSYGHHFEDGIILINGWAIGMLKIDKWKFHNVYCVTFLQKLDFLMRTLTSATSNSNIFLLHS